MKIYGRKIQRRAPVRCLCALLCLLIMAVPGMETLSLRAWAVTQYTVTFHANGGMFGTGTTAKETSVKTVTENKTVTAPTAPKRTGYTFTTGEWYTEPECENKWKVGTGGDPVTRNMTLYAKWTPKTYTVNYRMSNSTSGTIYTKAENQAYDSIMSAPVVAPTKDGYTFAGWYADTGYNQPWNFEEPFRPSGTSTTVNLFAKWDINSYTVTFDLQYDEKIETEQIEYNSTISKKPERYGYTFDGWYKSTDFTSGNKWSSTAKTPANDMTLYAKWTPNKYKVTFNSQGGTSVTAQTIEYGSKCTPKTPTKTGYTFDGWYRNAECTGEAWNFETDVVTDNITLYAKWIGDVYKVTFDTQGGSPVEAQQVSRDQFVTRPEDPVREGYTFVGWVTTSTGSTEYEFETAKVQKDITIYAKWTPIKYTVTFDSRGGSEITSDNPKLVSYDGTIQTKPSSTRGGYTFAGWWYKDENGKEAEWKFGSSTAADVTKVKRDVTVYAKWKTTVTFNLNGGKIGASSSAKTVEVYENSLITSELVPEPVNTGYKVAGWCRDPECATTPWDFDKDTVTQAITLYAKWEPTIYYRVTFKDYEDSIISEQEVAYNKPAVQPEDPTREGHTFKGWYTAKSGGSKFSFTTGIKEDKVIYAQWTINEYKVTFEKNGGTVTITPNPKTVKYGESCTEPTDPKKTGYDFGGWYSTPDFSGKPWNFTDDKVKGDMTLYAKWTTSKYTVTFILATSAAGAAMPEAVAVEHGERISEPAGPEAAEETYKFIGWYTSSTGTTLFDFEQPIIKDDTKVYAKYSNLTSGKIYRIQFNANGHGSAPAAKTQLAKGDKISQPIPTATGYTFGGWYRDAACSEGQKWDFDTDTVAKSQILYAKWTINSYTLSFDSQGGSDIALQTVQYKEKAMAPANPTKEGYDFGGWYKEAECANAWDFDTDVVTDNTTLYAKWTEVVVEPERYTVSFNMNGHGVAVSPVTDVVSGGKISAPQAPTETGYTFGGWYKEAECTNAWDFETDTVAADTTLYAKWTKVEEPEPIDPEASHKVDVIGDGTPKVNVNGLGDEVEELKKENPAASSVKITMTVEKKEETELSEEAQKIKEKAPDKATLEYLDIGITKEVEGVTSPISNTSNIIEVKVPFDFSGKSEIAIFRQHESVVESFAESSSGTDGTFTLDRENGFIHVFTQKFSVYAISYTKAEPSPSPSPSPPPSGSSGTVSYIVTASAGEGGSISPSGNIRVVIFRDLTLTVTPEEGYQIADVLVDGESMGPLSGYTFANVRGAHSIKAVFEQVPKPPEPGCPRDESCPAGAYKDVNTGAWYHDGVHYCLENGLMTGYTASRFGPNDYLTRAQLTQILYNLAGRPAVSGSSGFKDVPEEAWYAGAVAWARCTGVVSGYSDTRFAPGDLITREQLAAMIWRYAGSPVFPDVALDFKDSQAVSGYAVTALRWAAAEGIVVGSDGSLNPRDPATRAQASAMIMRFCTKE